MLKKFLALFTILFGSFFACFIVLYVLNVWLLVNQLPFCREAAYAWMLGQATTVCTEEDIAADVPWMDYEGPVGAMSGLPVPYDVQFFFGHDPNYFNGRWHGGVDIPCPTGTPIRATMSGVVSYAGRSDVGYGNLVVVENRGYQAFYAHASELAVEPGDEIEVGQVVALSGSTGFSTGPHVHYEVRVDGQPVDPLTVSLPGEPHD